MSASKSLTHDAGSLEGTLFILWQPIEAGGQEGMDRFRDTEIGHPGRRSPPIFDTNHSHFVDEHPEELFTKEGVAFRALDQPLTELGRKVINLK